MLRTCLKADYSVSAQETQAEGLAAWPPGV